MHTYTYDTLITGQLKTNIYRYPDEEREIICSTTLLQGKDINIVVDPGWRDEPLLEQLQVRGLTTDDIDLIYITHLHGDHYRSARLFPNIRWLAYGKEIEHWRERMSNGSDKDIFEKLEPIEHEVHTDITIIPTPGHTLGHTSVLFHNGEQKVLIAADAILCREYYEHRTVHPLSEDVEMALQSLDHASTLADRIIPGHDAPFDAIKK